MRGGKDVKDGSDDKNGGVGLSPPCAGAWVRHSMTWILWMPALAKEDGNAGTG